MDKVTRHDKYFPDGGGWPGCEALDNYAAHFSATKVLEKNRRYKNLADCSDGDLVAVVRADFLHPLGVGKHIGMHMGQHNLTCR